MRESLHAIEQNSFIIYKRDESEILKF